VKLMLMVFIFSVLLVAEAQATFRKRTGSGLGTASSRAHRADRRDSDRCFTIGGRTVCHQFSHPFGWLVIRRR
jgi:hypothetical protein